jgi:hypothetical protein
MVRRYLVVLGAVATAAAATMGLRHAYSVGEVACRWCCGHVAAAVAPPVPPAAAAPPREQTLPASADEEQTDVESWIGIAAATAGDELVVWSKTTIWSVAQRRSLLDGVDAVAAVAVAADGTVYAIRGDGGWLGVAKGAREEWRHPPLTGTTLGLQHDSLVDGAMLAQLVGLQTSGRWLAWFLRPRRDRQARLALTEDGGRSWIVQDLPEESPRELEAAAIRIEADGRLGLLAAYYLRIECGGRESVHLRGRVGSNVWRSRPDPVHAVGISEFLGFGDDGRTLPVASVTGAGRTYSIRTTNNEVGFPERDHLVRISGNKHWILAEAPLGMILMAVDRHGRPLGMVEGRPWRWSRRRAWEALDVATPSAPDP